jgi:dihydrofolate reductase
MRRLVLFMHVSLDGLVAGPNGEMDWIKVDDDIFGYAGKRTNEADTALYGRVTYEMMEAYWPSAASMPDASAHDIEHGNWYNQVTKVVLSRTMKGKELPNTIIVSDHLAEKIKALQQQPGKDIIIFGSPSAAHALMQENLIDDFWLFVNPVVLGKGIPLFKDVPATVQLQLKQHTAFSSGVVCLHYQRQ